RKSRHTTHLHDFPPKGTILRNHHPLECQTLDFLGWSHRHGNLQLLLVLPDDSRSLILAAWTDDVLCRGDNKIPPSSSPQPPPCERLESLSDLLRARIVVEVLLSRLACLNPEPSQSPQEDKHATTTELPTGTPEPHRRCVGTTRPPGAKRIRRRAGPTIAKAIRQMEDEDDR